MNVFSRLQLRATEARLPSQFTAGSKEVVQMADSRELLYVAELSFKPKGSCAPLRKNGK